MSFHGLNPLLGSLDHRVALHDGYININASAAVVTHNLKGCSVSKTGTGEYTIVVSNPGKTIKCVLASVVASTAVDLVAQVKSFSNSTVVIRLNAGATATNPSAACGIGVLIVSSESSL